MISTIRMRENFKLLMQCAHVFTRRVVQTIERIRELISCTNTSLKAAWRHCVHLSLRIVRTGGRTESPIQNNIHCKNYTLLKSDVVFNLYGNICIDSANNRPYGTNTYEYAEKLLHRC